MTRTRILTCLVLGAALGRAPAAAAQASDAELLARGRQFTAWFYAGQADSLWRATAASARPRGSADGFTRQAAALAARAGAEVAVLDEQVRVRQGRREYARTARFTAGAEPMVLRWVFDEAGAIVAVGLAPLSKAPPGD